MPRLDAGWPLVIISYTHPDSISIGQCHNQKHFQSMLKMREAPPLYMTIFFVWYVFLPAVYVVEMKDFMLFDLYKIKFENVEKK